MTVAKKPSLRQCINDNCISCIFDHAAAGTWRQQVTICPIKGCALYPVRPVSKSPIPESVMDYYLIPEAERAIYRLSRHPEGPVSKHNESEECPSEGPLTPTAETGPNRDDRA